MILGKFRNRPDNDGGHGRSDGYDRQENTDNSAPRVAIGLQLLLALIIGKGRSPGFVLDCFIHRILHTWGVRLEVHSPHVSIFTESCKFSIGIETNRNQSIRHSTVKFYGS